MDPNVSVTVVYQTVYYSDCPLVSNQDINVGRRVWDVVLFFSFFFFDSKEMKLFNYVKICSLHTRSVIEFYKIE